MKRYAYPMLPQEYRWHEPSREAIEVAFENIMQVGGASTASHEAHGKVHEVAYENIMQVSTASSALHEALGV